ncbi:MAG TPA: ABC-F family ATP-binding cassette domain-containing protein [Verrucomicrobiae bacterium]|nr:ABC-F family ATP-binding cassette domain-containing protein [Verrucomicrobiae bacterium]
MLTISEVSKSFGGRTLFSDVTLQVNRGDRIGLVGPNGAGKSTLFSLILKNDEPDTGQVTFQRNTTVGFLPQESAPAGDETVLELATAITPEVQKLQQQLKAWEQDHPGAVEHHDDIHARFDELGGYQLESKAKQILAGLSFREKDFNRPAREMSGGWVMRAHLARLLVQEPDLLMLDEPTNHLDLEALIWFQEYLAQYPGAILMISHDREFLNHLVGTIIEIRQSQLISYRGNYEDYLVQRVAKEEQLLAAYKNQQREIASLQEFADRFRAKASKASQAQSKLKQIARMEKIEAPVNTDRKINFSFPQPQRSGLKVITLKNIQHAYGENVVYRGIDYQAERDQRTVLVGPNGAGKSTLLKLLAGAMPVQGGERDLGHNVKAGYYSQYRVEMLQPQRTVLEEALDTPQRITEQFVRTVLGCFLFRGDDVFKKVKVLSGGEKSRLALVKLLLDPPNLLLMDEPTTHLDMPSIDALVDALKQFAGTLIFISHDVYFIRALATSVVHVHAGQLTCYSGDYQYYLDKTSATSARAALTAGSKSQPAPAAKPVEKVSGKSKDQKRLEAEQRQQRSRARREQVEFVARLEKEIGELEEKQTSLSAELEKPETYEKPGRAMEINRELIYVQERLAEIEPEWETASVKLAETESA